MIRGLSQPPSDVWIFFGPERRCIPNGVISKARMKVIVLASMTGFARNSGHDQRSPEKRSPRTPTKRYTVQLLIILSFLEHVLLMPHDARDQSYIYDALSDRQDVW